MIYLVYGLAICHMNDVMKGRKPGNILQLNKRFGEVIFQIAQIRE